MDSNAAPLWIAPRWTLAAMLAALVMISTFAIDAYLPAFVGIQESLGATASDMQLTLSGYIFGFGLMSLFHGALADSFGRRPVVLWGMTLFTLASIGCACAQNIEQLVVFRTVEGLSAACGLVVARAIVRDIFSIADAQKVMSQITFFYGLAPAAAPVVGGLLYVHYGWRSVFLFLAIVGSCLVWISWKFLPETLDVAHRQSFRPVQLLKAYYQIIFKPRFIFLSMTSGIPFNGMFIYVLSAPAFLGNILKLDPTQFFWFFFSNIAGITSGSWAAGRLAGKLPRMRLIHLSLFILLAAAGTNVAMNAVLAPSVSWAFFPIGVLAFGWALSAAAITIMVLDLVPERRGMASSLHTSIGTMTHSMTAGIIAPFVMSSANSLAIAALLIIVTGIACWLLGRPPQK